MPRTLIFFLLALLLPALGAAAVIPLGDETQLAANSDPEYYFTPPAVASRGSGFVVAWTASFARYPSGSQLVDWGGGVEARRVNPAGQPQGAKLSLVRETHKMDLSAPALASDTAGRFAVVWSSAPEHHPHIDRFVRQFASNGSVASTFRLDRFSSPSFSGQEELSAVALGASGRAFAVWPRPQPSNPEQTGLFGQIVLPSGQPAVPRFRVTTRAVSQRFPQIDTDRRGNAVLVYQNIDASFRPALYLRLYDRNGRPNGGEVRLTPAGQSQGLPALDVHADGHFALAWQQDNRIWARIYQPPYRPLGPAFPVTDGSRFAFSPDVAVGRDGTLLVTWEGRDPDNNSSQIWARAFSSSGTPLGEELRVDGGQAPVDSGLSTRPAVAASESNTFLVAWSTVDESFRSKIVSRLYGVTGPTAP